MGDAGGLSKLKGLNNRFLCAQASKRPLTFRRAEFMNHIRLFTRALCADSKLDSAISNSTISYVDLLAQVGLAEQVSSMKRFELGRYIAS